MIYQLTRNYYYTELIVLYWKNGIVCRLWSAMEKVDMHPRSDCRFIKFPQYFSPITFLWFMVPFIFLIQHLFARFNAFLQKLFDILIQIFSVILDHQDRQLSASGSDQLKFGIKCFNSPQLAFWFSFRSVLQWDWNLEFV